MTKLTKIEAIENHARKLDRCRFNITPVDWVGAQWNKDTQSFTYLHNGAEVERDFLIDKIPLNEDGF